MVSKIRSFWHFFSVAFVTATFVVAGVSIPTGDHTVLIATSRRPPRARIAAIGAATLPHTPFKVALPLVSLWRITTPLLQRSPVSASPCHPLSRFGLIDPTGPL